MVRGNLNGLLITIGSHTSSPIPIPTKRDEYDYAIDFGDRRERLRKSFEWEMDRLYLAEETARRRYARAKEAEAEKQRGNDAEDAELKRPKNSTTMEETIVTTDENDEAPDKDDAVTAKEEEEDSKALIPGSAKFDWSSFRRLSRVRIDDGTTGKEGDDPIKVCIIDILIGDPVIRSATTNTWYGYSGPSEYLKKPITKAKVHSSAIPGRNIMPERIRVRSSELIGVLLRILEPISSVEVEDLRNKPRATPVVFVRPFKTLLYCERALRDWCNALEKKFSEAPTRTTEAQKSQDEMPSAEDGILDNQSVDLPKEDDEMDTNQLEDGVKAEGRQAEEQGDREDDKRKEQSKAGEEDDENEEAEDPRDITKSRKALNHLKCLLSFVDSEILARKAFLDSPECRKIHYSDLWLLFQPGVDVIYDKDLKAVYRVIEVNSEPHRAVSSWERYFINPTATQLITSFSITCVYIIDFDGSHLGPVNCVFSLKPFEGEQEVTSLEIYPLRFFQPKQSEFSESEWIEFERREVPLTRRFRQKLIARGAKFLDVVKMKHMYYDGPMLGNRVEIESQVVVDFEAALMMGPSDSLTSQWRPELSILLGTTTVEDEALQQNSEERCRGTCCIDDFVFNDTHLEKKIRMDYIESLLPQERGEEPPVGIVPRALKELDLGSIKDNELIIMSFWVIGFVLRSRKWAQLDLSFMVDVHPPDTEIKQKGTQEPGITSKLPVTPFDRLVLEKGHRPMIESLVAQHFRDKESSRGPHEQVDIVKGEGKGLIILLHGAPGVGKTSTAEGVAELFRKPLFQITCGDLGTTAREVEQSLEGHFSLASRWGCILLLDEADVFLAARTKEDFIRNGLVAAFLRVMEYYTGILFLTTNRVGDFDEAFTSRIHISLYYPELDEEKTVGVFKVNMEMIEDRFALKGRRIVIDKMGIGSFASKHFMDHRFSRWNGGQIRNACQTALALAEFEAQGNSHESILKPDAAIELGVSHFETVQKAYLEFTKYMHDLYGTYASRKAKEDKLRATWIDQNDRVISGY
ncbi:hypothetical protein QBC37DRAFT_381233 [Rhypophila decipiens]|uniref:AAA+ ATPase domain-containing protein n=1 Tax=Rhypophila decipiens TaxID=261697 RepID=A0AAN6XVG0_9PEZI|nr:hypothetical protein QBC37DRAFT_381233 [Rhypophila decipiens]